MPSKRIFTAAEDDILRTMHAAHRSRADIAQAIGCARDTIVTRFRELGLDTSVASNGRVYPTERPVANRYRPPLRAGDPLTWGLLTAGTSLEGVPWPN